jgi:hypothetical protein
VPSYIVRELETDKEIHRVKLKDGCGERTAEKILMGLSRRLDLDKYYVDEAEVFDYFKEMVE